MKGLLSLPALSGYQISGLFVYNFDLLVDDLDCKPVNGNVDPVMLLAFDEEAGESGSVRRITAALCNKIDH